MYFRQCTAPLSFLVHTCLSPYPHLDSAPYRQVGVGAAGLGHVPFEAYRGKDTRHGQVGMGADGQVGNGGRWPGGEWGLKARWGMGAEGQVGKGG